MKNSPNIKARRGFTLIETMIAITILTLAMVGPLYTASRSIVAAQTARDQLTASYLAQEGIEYARMMRDNQYLSAYSVNSTNVAGLAWDHFLNGNPDTIAFNGQDPSSIERCVAPATCSLDSAFLDPLGNGVLSECTDGTCASEPLYLTGCTGGGSCPPPVYTKQANLAGSVRTPFVRTLQAAVISPNEVKIISTVSWDSHGTHYVVSASDHLTSWQ